MHPQTVPAETTPTLSASGSILSDAPRITVTLADLAGALDQIGSPELVSATRLYDTLCQLQSASPTAGALTTVQNQSSPIQSTALNPDKEVLSHKEIRRRILEKTKASFPDGLPPINYRHRPFTLNSQT